jgi:hypothetical protein
MGTTLLLDDNCNFPNVNREAQKSTMLYFPFKTVHAFTSMQSDNLSPATGSHRVRRLLICQRFLGHLIASLFLGSES